MDTIVTKVAGCDESCLKKHTLFLGFQLIHLLKVIYNICFEVKTLEKLHASSDFDMYIHGMKKLLSSVHVWFIIITLIMLTLNASPWVMRMRNNPSGRAFLAIHNSESDYPFYVSFIRQGLDGQWLSRDMYAVEEQKNGSIAYWFYILIGQVGRVFGFFDAHSVYHIGRYVLGLMWMCVLWLFLSYIIKHPLQRIFVYFLAIGSSSWPIIQYSGTHTTVTWALTWWTEFDPILRAAFLPHYSFGHICLIFSILSILRFEKMKKRIYLAMLIVCGWIAGFIHPPSLMIAGLIIPLWLISIKKFKECIIICFALGIASTSVLFINSQSNIFPWNLGRKFEFLSFALSMKDYIIALGPVVVPATFGVVVSRKKPLTWLWVLWVIVPTIMLDIAWRMKGWSFPIFYTVPISNIRFLQVIIWVPLAILSGETFAYILARWGKSYVMLLWGITAGLFFVGYPSSLTREYIKISPKSFFDSPPQGWVEAMQYLSKDTSGKPVLSMEQAGFYIPSYSAHRVFIGHEVMTPDAPERLGHAYMFYKGIGECDAYNLIQKYNIGYVFYGYDEQGIGSAVNTYPFLREEKTFGTTKIFRVTDIKPENCR